MEHTVDELEGAYRILRRRTPLFFAIVMVQLILAATIAIFANQVHDNTTTIAALQRQDAVIQSQQAITNAQFGVFLKAFIAEQNYACTILSEQAQKEGLSLPPPGTCDVLIPGAK